MYIYRITRVYTGRYIETGIVIDTNRVSALMGDRNYIREDDAIGIMSIEEIGIATYAMQCERLAEGSRACWDGSC